MSGVLYLAEALEPRRLLTLAPAGAEFLVNTHTASNQEQVAIAMDGDGDFVAAWKSIAQDNGTGFGVYAQRYSAAGVPRGPEFLVNTTVVLNQSHPAVAMDADGDFVIAWDGPVFGDDSYEVYFQRYSAAGVPLGGEVHANSTAAERQFSPSVAMDADGDFVVAWQDRVLDGSGYGIFARRFDPAGAARGAEFAVNTTTSGDQVDPAVAMDADGDFVVTWEDRLQDGSGSGVYARRFDAAGVAQGSEFRVNGTTASDQSRPAVATGLGGDFVVAWDTFGQDGSGFAVYAQRYAATGFPQGGEFRVNTVTGGGQSRATVAADAGGNFLVAWQGSQDAGTYGIYAQRFTAAGAAVGAEFRVNTTSPGRQQAPAAAIDADGDFVVAWESYPQDGSSYGVYAQRYEESVDAAGPIVSDVTAGGIQLKPGGRVRQSVSSLILMFSEELSIAGGAAGANSASNRANYALSRNGVDVSSEITSAAFAFNPATLKYEATLTFAAPLINGNYFVTARQALRDPAGNALDGGMSGFPGSGDFVRPFSVAIPAPVGSEFQVNTFVTGNQFAPAVASDADGDILVAWTSDGQDSSGLGVYYQRFTPAGVAQQERSVNGPGFQGAQSAPALAVDADGDHVIVWESANQDGNGYGIYAKRHNANRTAEGIGEFRVNTTTAGQQRMPDVAMDADGDFVVVWQSENAQDGSRHGVFGQRFNAEGVTLGPEFQVNSFTPGVQFLQSVAMDADGNFVVAWASYDVEDFDVYAKRYNAAGAELAPPAGVPRGVGNEFRVNTTTAGSHTAPDVAMDADGDFIVAWEGPGQGSAYAVLAQRYNAAGEPQGGQFQVNVSAPSILSQPSAAMDADGDIFIAWGGGSQDQIYARRFDASGPALGGEFIVNTTVGGVQRAPSVAVDADGDFVVAWETNAVDGSFLGVAAQRFDDPVDTAGPLVSDVALAGLPFAFDNIPITEGERLAQGVSSLLVRFSESMSVAGGTTGANSVTNRANFGLTRNGADASASIASVAFTDTARKFATLTFTAPLGEGNYVLTARPNLRDPAGNLLDGDADGIPGGGGGFSRAFTVSAPVRLSENAGFSEFRANTTTAGAQAVPAVAMDADGDFVVVWQSNAPAQDGSGFGIYAQRYTAAGALLGPEFRVNTTIANDQVEPAVAMDPAGNFVVVWESGAANDRDIFGRRFNANAQAQGIEFRVNTSTTASMSVPSVAMDADGDFVVVWQSGATTTADVFVQMYTAAGATLGSNFLPNFNTAGGQFAPDVAMDANGDFAVVWHGTGQDSSGSGVFRRVFTRGGGQHNSGEIRVNNTEAGDQVFADVAMDADGEFVVAWTSYGGQDGDGKGIYVTRFNGTESSPDTGEVRVNTFTAGDQNRASVAMDADGDFVVAWQSFGQDAAGGQYGAYAQRFTIAAVPVGPEIKLNNSTFDDQQLPAVASDADGDTIFVWQSDVQDTGATPGVYGIRYAANEAPTTLGIPAVNVAQDEADTAIDLRNHFNDTTDNDQQLTYSVVSNTNPGIFNAVRVTQGLGTLTLDYAPGRSGVAVLTVRATDTGGMFVDTLLNVTVTPTGPFQVSASDFVFQSPPHRFRVTFNREAAPASLQPQDLSVQPLGGGNAFPATAVSYDPATRTATFTLVAAGQQFIANGNYRATLAAGSVSDTFGNPLMAGSTDFFSLIGDINRDRAVNGTDFAILAGNFGKTGQAFAQGDLNGDAAVNGTDFALLAGNFGKTVPAALVAPAAAVPPSALALDRGQEPGRRRLPVARVAHPPAVRPAGKERRGLRGLSG